MRPASPPLHRRAAPLVLLVSVALLATACGEGGASSGSGGEGAGGGAPRPLLTLATFDAGLARGDVRYADERARLVPDALAALDVDVLCLNEVWDEGDLGAIRAALGVSLPTSAVLEDMQETREAACPEEAVEPLLDCMADACGDVPDPTCVLASCNDDLDAQSAGCRQCLDAQLETPLDAVRAACAEDGERWAHRGAFGGALFTDRPVLASEALILDASVERRGAQYMLLDVDGARVHVVCTQLTANRRNDYVREVGSWADEQAAQLQAVLTWLAARAGEEPAILLGNLATGPESEDLGGELEASWKALTEAGWVDPLWASAPSCTWCGDNPLVRAAGDESVTELVDHVLFLRAAGTFAAARILDGELMLETTDDGTVASRLSDHYGVRVEWTR